jgi:hypothetical protein
MDCEQMSYQDILSAIKKLKKEHREMLKIQAALSQVVSDGTKELQEVSVLHDGRMRINKHVRALLISTTSSQALTEKVEVAAILVAEQ